MPSRSMKEANTSIFTRLDEYCMRRAEPLSNAGRARWISTTHEDKKFLIWSVLSDRFSFSPSIKIARFDFAGRVFFVTSGFELMGSLLDFQAEDLDAGILTAFLAELDVDPQAPPSKIKDIVEVDDKASSPGYCGHDLWSIAELYPSVQVLSTEDLPEDESYRAFLMICLSDRRCVDQWIDEGLSNTLRSIAELSPRAIPYQILCRSVLDLDPASLFLALYRCLEALYSRHFSRALMNTLQISKPWHEMSQTLEEELGWRPREEPSLERLFGFAMDDDMRSIISALGGVMPAEAKPSTYAAKRVYALRNGLVHYRPFRDGFSADSVDWNALCKALAQVMFHVYDES